MMTQTHHLFCLADSTFFEELHHWHPSGTRPSDGNASGDDLTITSAPLPDGWVRRENGIWTSVRPRGMRLPDQGWKIHVSATTGNVDRVTTTVFDHCTATGVAFKHLRNRSVVFAMNSKYAPRTASGKAVTIYPADERELHRLLDTLGDLLADEPGPGILTDLPWGRGPLFVRYGAFRPMRCLDADGRSVAARYDADGALVPDVRAPGFRPPADVPVPAFLAERLAELGGAPPEPARYQVEQTLHFSNAGGVYRGRRVADGRTVVLKEARAHAAVDDNHHDAVQRLGREADALERLAGVDGVPELLDRFSVGDHHFIVEEFVEGQALHVWRGCTHPWTIDSDPAPSAVAAFTEEVLDIVARLRRLVSAIHARGMVFGDLHLGNVIVRPDGRVALVDFELAFDATDTDWLPGLRAAGFAARHKRGTDIDEHGLAAIELALFLMLNRVIGLDPAKLDQFVGIVEAAFALPAGWGKRIRSTLTPPPRPVTTTSRPETSRPPDLTAPAPDLDAVTASVAAGIRSMATPDRPDRLFPGDVEQFGGGALGLANGAAGVLWALEHAGHGRDVTHEQWLLDALPSRDRLRTGMFDGSAGIAWMLGRLGHMDEADRLIAEDLPEPDPRTGVSLHSGLAGTGLVRLDAGLRGDARCLRHARTTADMLVEAIRTGSVRADGQPLSAPAGLLRGWSGAALFLVRMYETDGRRDHLDAAVRAVHRDLDACVATRDGSLQVEEPGLRTLGYLETGSAGLALVADELLDHVDDTRVRDHLPGLAKACRRTFVAGAGLYTGRAGLLAALSRIGGRHGLPSTDDDVAGHVHRLGWHAVRHHGEIAFPGRFDLRLSADLATGAAGVLFALSAASGRTDEFLPFFGRRAAPLRPAGGATDEGERG